MKTYKKKDKILEPLTFKRFHAINTERCRVDIKTSNDWTHLEWGGALAGEVGELCNFLKKMRRGEQISKKKLAHEIADILTYVSLLSYNLDIDMEASLIEKFNIVSKRWGSKYRL